MTILFELVANDFAYDKFYVNKVYPDKYTMSFFICPLPPKSSYCARRIVETWAILWEDLYRHP